MKKFILGFVMATLIFNIMPVSATIQEYILQKSDVKLVVDGGEYANSELPTLNYKGYNYVPADAFRGICDKIGVGFKWDNATKEIQLKTEVAEAPTEIDTGEGNTVSEVKIIRDVQGELKLYEIEGNQYYEYGELAGHFYSEYRGYVLNSDAWTGEVFLVKPGNMRVHDLEHTNIDGRKYIRKEYYENTILPLIQ